MGLLPAGCRGALYTRSYLVRDWPTTITTTTATTTSTTCSSSSITTTTSATAAAVACRRRDLPARRRFVTTTLGRSHQRDRPEREKNKIKSRFCSEGGIRAPGKKKENQKKKAFVYPLCPIASEVIGLDWTELD